MREIKFREWDAERESLMPGHGLSYSEREEFDDMTGFRFEHEEDLEFTNRSKETDESGTPLRILEQFTGLKDANDVEIYENDVIETFDGIRGYVAFEDGTFSIRIDDMSAPLSNYLIFGDLSAKVIGNVHQNPELLEG